MQKPKHFQSIFDRNQFFMDEVRNKSVNWYWKQVDELSAQRITPTKILEDNKNKTVSSIRPGELYFYKYDPKHKDTLEYYDTFPMVFPFTAHDNGFTGINMHYLPYNLRIALLDNLFEYKSNQRLDETTRLKLSWGMLKTISKHKLVAPTVHRYLYGHIKSSMIKIDSYHWATAMMMPVARFKKASETSVWMDSRKKIK